MLGETFAFAFQAIRRNALRSFLTTLGVVIGVGSVIAIVSLGDAASQFVVKEISSLGSNLMVISPRRIVRSGKLISPPPFTYDDVDAIRKYVDTLDAVAPYSDRSGIVSADSIDWRTEIVGTDNDIFPARQLRVQSGREFADSEITMGTTSCIIGETVRRQLFGAADPIGETIRVQNIPCQVVGLLAFKGDSMLFGDQDDTVLMPLLAYQRRESSKTTGSRSSSRQPVRTRDAAARAPRPRPRR